MSEKMELQLAQLNQCFKQVDEIYHKLAVRYKLSDSAFWILYSLCESKEPCTQNDFCQDWFFPKQTVNSTIANLVKVGYIALESMPGSRNSKRIVMTEAGKAYTKGTIKPLLRAEQAAFERMSEEERETYLELTRKHISYLDEEIKAFTK